MEKITFLEFKVSHRLMPMFELFQKLRRLVTGGDVAVASSNQPNKGHLNSENVSNTNLLQFPHGGNVVLELIQTPECGDSQLCVLNPHLQLAPPLLVVGVRAAVSATEDIGFHGK